MNNNPNFNRSNGQRPTRQQNGEVRRPVQRMGDRQPRPQGRPEQRHMPRTAQPRPLSDGRRTVQPRSGNNRLGTIAVVWIALLAVILVILLIIAGLGNEPETAPAGGTALQTTVNTTVTTTAETFPVDHAVYNDDTLSFAGDLSFTNGILIDIENSTVVASRGGDARIYPASMTKVMTLIVAAEAVKDLDETFTMTAEITDPLYLANASVAGFLVGEEVTVRDLIYGLILPSGGDGALGLAYHIAGSEEAFADMMNDKVKELGLTNTHFTNCTGLHDADHYSTCHEIAMIVEYAIKDPFMREVLTTYQYTTEVTPEHPEGILLTSTLLSRMAGNESGTMFVQGGKTGYTTEAKNCLASFATELVPGLSENELKLQPTKYILVTAGSGEKFGPVFDAIRVYKSFSEDEDDPAESAGVAGSADAPDIPDVPAGTDKAENTAYNAADTTDSVKIYTAATPS